MSNRDRKEAVAKFLADLKHPQTQGFFGAVVSGSYENVMLAYSQQGLNALDLLGVARAALECAEQGLAAENSPLPLPTKVLAHIRAVIHRIDNPNEGPLQTLTKGSGTIQ
ncbi:hypothetical protein [Ferrovibrio terrae]|uniref:hypothetical protein n=1 Tax=Ferrovibrio terrae TaxID=2594003 RepID=UPI003137E152